MVCLATQVSLKKTQQDIVVQICLNKGFAHGLQLLGINLALWAIRWQERISYGAVGRLACDYVALKRVTHGCRGPMGARHGCV